MTQPIKNVLSLFDGISCAQIALERSGFKVEKYFASEIEKNSIKVTQHNYPNTTQLGDITKVKASDLPQIDLLVGGSPCQGFAFCGKQLNFDDPRSKLFFEYVRLLRECKPKYFLLENVRMKKEYETVISNQLGVESILIDSTLLSAQKRARIYWTNILGVEQPQDRCITTKDILDIEGPFEYLTDWDTSYREYRHQFVYFAFCEAAMISGQQYRNAAYLNKKHQCITCMGAWHILTANDKIRKTTLLEQERLQTLPDNYTNIGVSKSSRHKMIGNCFTVDVIVHMLKCIVDTKVFDDLFNIEQLTTHDFDDIILD